MTPGGPTPEATYERLVNLLNRIDQRLALSQKWEDIKLFAATYPLVAVMVVVTGAMCSIPVACFVAFAMGSVLLTVMGFMIIEGVLLTFGAMCLGMSLLVMGFLSLGICAFIGVSWLTMLAVQKIFTGVKARIPDGYKSKIPFARKSETEQIKPDINDDEINK